MAEAFLTAKRFPETLQTWINTALGESWEDKGDTVEAAGLASRRESYTANAIPDGIALITVGTDVQDDRLETFVYGWGRDEECWRIEHIVLRGDPTQPQIWAEHDEILRKRYRTDDGRDLLIEATCVDSGGHCTEAVYKYAVGRKRYRVFAIKGVGGPGRLVWPKRPSRVSKNRADLWPIGVDTIKDVIYGRLKKVTEPGPGYFHFDAAADDAFFTQLASETLIYKLVQGRKVRLWRPKSSGIRQEGLDGTVYAYAAMIARGGNELLATRATRADAQAVKAQQPIPEMEPEPGASAEALVQPKPRKLNPFRPRQSWMKRRGW
jgi:phage terminase large subunit GpA-like protein